jgi:hypothetical protein
VKNMTLQEVFDKIWERAKDKRKSLRDPSAEHSKCAYRSPDGLKCFIGVLLPDQNYMPVMDDGRAVPAKTGVGYVKDFIPLASEVFEEHLHALQRIHDNAPPHRWEECLRNFAARRELTVPQ